MIRNRYNYPTSPIRDIKGKEIQTRTKWTLMETSVAESQTDSYFPTKWPNVYSKQKDVSDTHIQRQTITKINHDRRTALERFLSRVGKGIICSKTERKAMIGNRYNYPIPPIRDTKPRSSIMPSNISD